MRNKDGIYNKALFSEGEYYIRMRHNIKTGCVSIFSTKKEKEYRNKINQKVIQKSRIILHSLKINGCAICGYSKYDACLDFHHTNSKDKNFYIGTSGLQHTNIKIAEELNKCILLCCRCHRELHVEERLINEL